MASSSSSDSINTIATTNPSSHNLINLHHNTTIKLTQDNYLLWKAQIVPYIKGLHLFGFLDGTKPAPPQSITSQSSNGVGTVITNPEFLQWHLQDQLILSALTSSLSESILTHVVKCLTSRDVWKTLECMFSSQDRARLMQIHYQIATLKKGNLSVADYFQRYTNLVDTLASIGNPLNDYELVSYFLSGPGSEYDFFVTSITTRVDPMTLDDLYGHLFAHELRLEQNQPAVNLALASANIAAKKGSSRGGHGGRSQQFFSSGKRHNSNNNSNRNSRGRGRGCGSNLFSGAPRTICQVCLKPGHDALDCYHRFENSYQRDSNQNMQAYFAAPQPVTDPSWYPDSGATHHITSDLANLNMRAEKYTGSNQIKMGNGTGLDIKHIGQTKIFTPITSFLLHDVLHVPLIKKNLLSVHKFTKDTKTYLEFHPSCFFVKDQATGKVLVQGPSNHGLYSFPSSLFRRRGPSSRPVSSAFVSERATLTQWHSRLGHPALRVVSHVVSKFGLPVFANKMDSSCPACLSSKSHRLVFSFIYFSCSNSFGIDLH